MCDSPKATKPTNGKVSSVPLAQAVQLVTRTFLEEKHFRKLHRFLSQEWCQCHSLTAAVRLMQSHGVHISEEEGIRLSQLPEERMIDALVQRMPSQSREQFEHFFLQLSLIASTTTRLRAALEAGFPEAVEEALTSAEDVGILQFVLKMAVAQAGQEVTAQEQSHDQWLTSTDARISPLLQSQANSMALQKALAQAKAQLTATRADANEKSKSVLLRLGSNSEATLVSSAFIAWCDHARKMKKENEIRKEYEEQIEEAQKKLLEYKEAQLGGVRSVIERNIALTEGSLIQTCFNAFREEVEDAKQSRDNEKGAQAILSKIKGLADNAAANAKSVLNRMHAGSNEALTSICFTAWVQFLVDYRQNKVMEDALKSAEKKVSEFMKKQNDGAKTVLSRMTASSDSGLLATVFKGWFEHLAAEKKGAEMQEKMDQQASKATIFATRNRESALNGTSRGAAVQELGTCIIVFSHWKRDVKIERWRRYGKDKNNKRKQQLVGVKGLFKNFASELESGLKEGTPRVEAPQGRSKSSGPISPKTGGSSKTPPRP